MPACRTRCSGSPDQARTPCQLRLRRLGRRQDGRSRIGRPLLRPRRDGALRDGLHAPAAVHRWQCHGPQRRAVEPVAHQPEPDLQRRCRCRSRTRTRPATSGRRRYRALRPQPGLQPRLLDAVERRGRAGDLLRASASRPATRATARPAHRPSSRTTWPAGPTVRTDSSSNIQARRPDQFLGDNGPWLTNDGRTRYDQFLVIARARRSGLFAQLSWAYTHARRNFAGAARPDRQPRLGLADQQRRLSRPDARLPAQPDDRRLLHLGAAVPAPEHDGRRQDRSAAGSSRPTASGTSRTRAAASTPATTRTPTARAATSRPSTAPSATRRRRSPARATCSTSGSTPSRIHVPERHAQPHVRPHDDRRRGQRARPAALGVARGRRPDEELQDRRRHPNAAALRGVQPVQPREPERPNTSVNSSDFGKIRGKYGEGRRIQLGVRFMF